MSDDKPRDENHADCLGQCEGCDKNLFDGDGGYRYDDGPIICENCAPTWSQAKENWAAQSSNRPDDYAEFIQAMNEHVAAGGSMEDKIVREL